MAASMSCNCGRCSSSSTATCQEMGVIDLLLWTAEYQKKKTHTHALCNFSIIFQVSTVTAEVLLSMVVARASLDHTILLSAMTVDIFTSPRLVQTLSGSLSTIMKVIYFRCILLPCWSIIRHPCISSEHPATCHPSCTVTRFILAETQICTFSFIISWWFFLSLRPSIHICLNSAPVTVITVIANKWKIWDGRSVQQCEHECVCKVLLHSAAY